MSPEMINTLMPPMMAQADTCQIGVLLYEGLPKDMLVFDGVRLAQQLLRLGLVDTFDPELNPVILGEGQPLCK